MTVMYTSNAVLNHTFAIYVLLIINFDFYSILYIFIVNLAQCVTDWAIELINWAVYDVNCYCGSSLPGSVVNTVYLHTTVLRFHRLWSYASLRLGGELLLCHSYVRSASFRIDIAALSSDTLLRLLGLGSGWDGEKLSGKHSAATDANFQLHSSNSRRVDGSTIACADMVVVWCV